MSEVKWIEPVRGPIRGRIRPPGSKSLSNRALLIAGLAAGESLVTGLLDSQDTRVMVESLKRLGIDVQVDGNWNEAWVRGCDGEIPAREAELWVENSGTSIRFLTAACSLGEGTFRLDGNARMRERPIEDLIVALRRLGVSIESERGNGCPPVVLRARGLRGGSVEIAGNVSSQFLSGLLMVAPYAGAPLEIGVAGELVSEPYVEMTVAVMRAFGGSVESPRPGIKRVAKQGYRGRAYEIEPDASAASYFFAAAAITGGEVVVEGLDRRSLQGDVKFVDVLQAMGCEVSEVEGGMRVRGRELKGVDVDMNEISDTAQTLAAVAVFAEGPTRIRNVAHMRLKETDRVRAVVNELTRLGVKVEEHDDGMTIWPGGLRGGEVETYDDHRMAMSFSLLGLKQRGIGIQNPGCVGKTYPGYFDDLERVSRGGIR